MGHAGGMLDEGFCVPKRDRAPDKVEPVHHVDACAITAFQLNRDHAAKAGHLFLCEFMLGKALQARIGHALNGGVIFEHFGDHLRVCGMAFDAQFQCFQTA